MSNKKTNTVKWYNSIKTKNLLFFITIGVLFLSAIIFNFSMIRNTQITQKAKERIRLETDVIVRELLLKQKEEEQIVKDIAKIATINQSEKMFERLLDFKSQKEIIGIGVWFEDGAYFYHDREGEKEYDGNYKDDDFYQLGMQLRENETFWTQIYKDKTATHKVVAVVSPIYHNNKFVGVASLEVAIDVQEKELFYTALHSQENYFLLTDRLGNFILRSLELQKFKDATNIYTLGVAAFENLMQIDGHNFHGNEEEVLETEIEHKRHNEKIIQKIEIVENDFIFHEKTVVSSYYFPHTGWHMIIAIPEHLIFADMISLYNKIIATTIIFTIIAALFGYIFIQMNIVKPLISLSNQIKRGADDEHMEIFAEDKGEISILVESFNNRNKALLQAHEEQKLNEKLLLQQSKMASMGEMLDAVAHQWKQPLNALSMYSELLGSDFDEGAINKKYITSFQKDIQTQISHMVNTLQTFRQFFRPDTQAAKFSLNKVVNDVLLLVKDELIKNNIEVTVEDRDEVLLFGFENEIKHLILNLMSNAKDALVQKNILQKQITIIVTKTPLKSLEVIDNAGGVQESIQKDIFKAHFTTKAEGKGTGIGLYMSSLIAQKHHAELSVANKGEGASFRVVFSNI
ncbi:ATP-binding protein [Sulfurimonas sp.]